MTKKNILAFIKQQKLCVVSTIDSSGKPQSAVVEFGELDNLTIIISTDTNSRKFTNLRLSPHVAVVIGWDDNITVQMSAVAKLLVGSKLEQAQAAFFAKDPKAQRWQNRPNIVYFAFEPTWVRYSDLTSRPWKIEEFDVG